MRTLTYLILGLLFIFIILAFMVAQPSVNTITGIVLGGITLVMIPFVIYWMRHVPKRDRKHQDSDFL
jgi:hypothetical protein